MCHGKVATAVFLLSLFSLFVAGCGERVEYDRMGRPMKSEADYVLPFPSNRSYRCVQTFNGTVSHRGAFRYAVDFAMPRGSLVTAAREGEVVLVVDEYTDDQYGPDRANLVAVRHDDGTWARYVHLTRGGAWVKTGQIVKQGDPIGRSGKSGARTWHLHFDVTRGEAGREAQTIPFRFSDAYPAHYPLKAGVVYRKR